MNSRTYTVITGASSGIGYETAKAFAARGKNVIVTARRRERLEKLRAEILAANPDVEVVVRAADLSVDEDAVALYESLRGFDIETWVNNAGRGNRGDITNPELPQTLEMLHTNMDAVAILSSLYVRDYKDRPGAQLINVASSAGYTLFPGCAMYAATKFFVSALTEAIDHEMQLAGYPLRAKVLAPGATQTEFEQTANALDEPVDYTGKFPRFHTAAQMAQFLLALYDGDKTVGEIDFATFGIRLSDAKHPSFGFTPMAFPEG
ncbi:MAG: SDR family NAD(P)-dependent oxidoreductase [Hominenteromicrobium sp.]